MKVLVFGGKGQDGLYISRLCSDRGYTFLNPYQTDVSDLLEVSEIIDDAKPDIVFQLAAKSTIEHNKIFVNHSAIATGTLHVLEAVKRHALSAKVMVIGSALQFKNENGKSISETSPFEASSGYAVARIYAAELSRYYRSLGVRSYTAYLFHHDSPERNPPHLAGRIARAARTGEKIKLARLDVEKEWNFAGDVVDGMFVLLGQDEIHEAVIGSGLEYSIRSWIEACYSITGMDWRQFVTEDPGPKQTCSWNRLVSNPKTLMSLGWQPKVGLVQLAKMMVHTPDKADIAPAASET